MKSACVGVLLIIDQSLVALFNSDVSCGRFMYHNFTCTSRSFPLVDLRVIIFLVRYVTERFT